MHLSRLESFLESISEGSKFIGRPFVDVIGDAKIKVYGMHGMLYLMSLDLVEWIAHSPIPRENLIGIEDQQVGYWLQKSNIAMEREIMPAAQLHDRADAPGHKHWQHAITKETIVVHRCKEIPIFLRCLSNLFSDDTKKLKSTDRLLKQPQAAITHASESLGLLFTPNQMKQTLRAIKQTLIQNPRLMTIREYNSLLTQEFQRVDGRRRSWIC
ncbi:hypothetical protein BCR33DRAFT_490914 [Rhizoclosmatium globosum]|uniref:Uncharacterized protein n=1 Tax=Rhizoclosmatium globosum TaxID=329046 RepID=A0A1Y2BMK2_9FUNG|nr:hypothetical protein BCR33DRAFT_490914 [Rhizoclosmatium globosum]|eukprot:ORY35978.1 hypothetical protein BCR33DRAFT_490914 [Rhizoclosmatium globosum]